MKIGTKALRNLEHAQRFNVCNRDNEVIRCADARLFWFADYTGSSESANNVSVDYSHANVSWIPNFNQKSWSGMRIQPTPKLTVGSIEFYGNSYVDYLIFQIFFRQGEKILVNGTFLETGASNGVHASNTLFYDGFLNWEGILIEPTLCAKCQLPVNRPRSVIIHGGICASNSTFPTESMRSFCPGPQDACLPRSAWTIPVPCMPLQHYIHSSNSLKSSRHHLDFVSIDVEEHYMTVLKSIDWEAVDISVIVIECKSMICENYLRDRGYTVVPAGTIPGIDEDAIAWKNTVDCDLAAG